MWFSIKFSVEGREDSPSVRIDTLPFDDALKLMETDPKLVQDFLENKLDLSWGFYMDSLIVEISNHEDSYCFRVERITKYNDEGQVIGPCILDRGLAKLELVFDLIESNVLKEDRGCRFENEY